MEVAPNWRAQDVYESSPAAALSAKLATEGGFYTWSHFVPSQPLGTIVDHLRSENLECLTFDDEAFDIVVTQDVFEHVLRPEIGISRSRSCPPPRRPPCIHRSPLSAQSDGGAR